ncbi:MAG: carbonic anhydrase [Crocinitomicaceae bacterium]
MNDYQKILLQNKAWAEDKLDLDPLFFERMSNIQTPEFLWIGCSDSRVPANEITGTTAGEIFVHRNIANLVVHTDLNILSVLKYAVEVLQVKHVIVCGHYGCGGVNAALTNQDFGFLNKWLRNIKDVYRLHFEDLKDIQDHKIIQDRMVEFNVIEQVHNLAQTSIIQHAWKDRQGPILHGCVYKNNEILTQIYCRQ